MWAITGVPFGVKGRTDVWVDFPQSNTDNNAAAKLLHPEVGIFVALGGAPHLTEAVSRLNDVFASTEMADADGGGSAPAAMRGYAGLLSMTDARDAPRAAARPAATKRKVASKARKGSKKTR